MKAPEIGPVRFSDDLRHGKRTFVTCGVIDGDPPFTFTWLKDGNHLQENDIYKTANVDGYTSTLSISSLSAESNGNYTCRVSNAYGKDEKYDAILIKGNLFLIPFDKWEFCIV